MLSKTYHVILNECEESLIRDIFEIPRRCALSG